MSEAVTTYTLGQKIEIENVGWLITRIVQSSAIFEIPKVRRFILNEHYIELLSDNGDIEFVTLTTNEEPVEIPQGDQRNFPEPPVFYKEPIID